MRLSGLLIKRPTMRELNLVLLPILFVLLIVYLLIAISYQEGNPFINNVFTFDREDSSAPWFSVVYVARFPFHFCDPFLLRASSPFSAESP